MIHKSDQGFSTFDTISIVTSVLLLALIITPIIIRRVDTQYAEVAKHQAQEWSQKITSLEKLSDDSKSASQSRNPASLQASGTVGADPWGQPFHYQYARNSSGQPVYIVVWSPGPNAKNETEESQITVSPEGFLSINFEGDDVGYVRAVR
jgi:hypothetical protein